MTAQTDVTVPLVIRSIAKKMKEAAPLTVTTQKVADASLRDGPGDAARR